MLAHQRPRAVSVAEPAGGEQTLNGGRERQQRLERFLLLELRGDIERRSAVTDRPEVNVIAAGRLLSVLSLARAKVEEIAVRLEHFPNPVAEPERGGEEDVGGRATFDEIPRQLEAAGASPAVQHPLRRRRAMIDVSRIDVRARVEQQIDDRARSREVQRSLSIAAALVHARWIVADEACEQLGAIEMCGRAGVRHGARGEQAIRRRPRRRMQRVKTARPPAAAPIGVRAELEQHVHHREVIGERDDGGRVEAEHGLIEPRAELRVLR